MRVSSKPLDDDLAMGRYHGPETEAIPNPEIAHRRVLSNLRYNQSICASGFDKVNQDKLVELD